MEIKSHQSWPGDTKWKHRPVTHSWWPVTGRPDLQTFKIVKHSSLQQQLHCLDSDEMIRLSAWLLGFCPMLMVTHKGLHNGVVCGVHVGVEWKGALSLAIVRRVSLRSDDPVLRVRMESAELVTTWICSVPMTVVMIFTAVLIGHTCLWLKSSYAEICVFCLCVRSGWDMEQRSIAGCSCLPELCVTTTSGSGLFLGMSYIYLQSQSQPCYITWWTLSAGLYNNCWFDRANQGLEKSLSSLRGTEHTVNTVREHSSERFQSVHPAESAQVCWTHPPEDITPLD